MPRNSLTNLGQSQPPQTTELPEDADIPDELATLLRERQALEQQMQALTGGSARAGATADPRFPVTPLTQRRAQDQQWLEGRDAASGGMGAAGGSADIPRRLSELRRVGREIPDLAAEPPQRSGQRALRQLMQQLPAGRQLSGLSDTPAERTGQRARRDNGAALRGLADLPDRGRDLLDSKLDSLVRELGTRIPVPDAPALRDLDDHLQRARKRLDILEGGSGQLDRLRDTAARRLQGRRRDQARDERRDAARKERNKTASREDKKDKQRDAARLDRNAKRKE